MNERNTAPCADADAKFFNNNVQLLFELVFIIFYAIPIRSMRDGIFLQVDDGVGGEATVNKIIRCFKELSLNMFYPDIESLANLIQHVGIRMNRIE